MIKMLVIGGLILLVIALYRSTLRPRPGQRERTDGGSSDTYIVGDSGSYSSSRSDSSSDSEGFSGGGGDFGGGGADGDWSDSSDGGSDNGGDSGGDGGSSD